MARLAVLFFSAVFALGFACAKPISRLDGAAKGGTTNP
jgi:hypothetical protein